MARKAKWTVFADGVVGDEVLRTIASHDPDAVSCIISTSDRSEELSSVFRAGIFHTWEQLQNDDVLLAVQGRSEVVFLAWWPHLLRGKLLDLGQKVMLNMHPSLLPHCRGKDPNFWCLVEERPAGVTIHHVTSAVDAGDIAFQRQIPISWTDTGETIHKRAQRALIALFDEVYRRIATLDVPRIKQHLDAGSFHRRSELDQASLIELDRSYSARNFLNLLRARTYDGHPACTFFDDGAAYEVRISIRRKNESS